MANEPGAILSAQQRLSAARHIQRLRSGKEAPVSNKERKQGIKFVGQHSRSINRASDLKAGRKVSPEQRNAERKDRGKSVFATRRNAKMAAKRASSKAGSKKGRKLKTA